MKGQLEEQRLIGFHDAVKIENIKEDIVLLKADSTRLRQKVKAGQLRLKEAKRKNKRAASARLRRKIKKSKSVFLLGRSSRWRRLHRAREVLSAANIELHDAAVLFIRGYNSLFPTIDNFHLIFFICQIESSRA